MSRGVVLMYHRVATLERDPYGLAVDPGRFIEQVDHLTRLNCVVPLREVVQPSDSLRVAITFDDGYLDNATTAAPLLAAAGLPVTWFITSGRLGGQRFWWDRLAHALLGSHALPGELDVDVGGRPLWVDLREEAARETALRFLHRRLRPLPPDVLDATVTRLLETLGVSETPQGELSMGIDHLRSLAEDPLFEIGAHTRTHLQLSGQLEHLQRAEIQGSVEDLRELTGQPVTSFAFPFGSESAVGALAPRLVEEAGCDLACSTRHGSASSEDDRLLLPRLAVADWDVGTFDAALREVAG